ncbi:uncharacterized protein LOC141761331 [Sebastes fasciatus]|uniref:uncharacterized protein LOC141761331 n=1 Tax=Sebastes fasciatus TaxID=394691 RepID=UPI003D9F9545
MKTFTLITAITLCRFIWISVSGSESQTVEAQSGEEVTLTCSNMSSHDSTTWWSRMVDRTKASLRDGTAKLTSMILGGLTVFLVAVIIGLIVKNRKLQTGWISVSVSESQTVEAQSGEEVTLTCFNMSSSDSMIWWSRMVDGTKASCITVMFNTNSGGSHCDRGQISKFEMISNISTVSLKIKDGDSSDSGLYFCEFYSRGRPTLSVIRLNVKGKVILKSCLSFVSDGIAKLTSMILGGLTVFLVAVIVGLVVKVRKLQTADGEEQNPEQRENMGSDELNYAALSFQAKPKRSRRPAPEREMEPHVVYAATR